MSTPSQSDTTFLSVHNESEMRRPSQHWLSQTVDVEFPDKSIHVFPCPVKCFDIAVLLKKHMHIKTDIYALEVNNLITSLNEVISFTQVKVKPIMKDTVDGHAILRRSLVFLVGLATHLEFPEFSMTVEHSLRNGYMCLVEDTDVTTEQIAKIEHRMKDLVSRDLPILTRYVSYETAMEFFEKIVKRPFTASLISANNDPAVPIDYCDGIAEQYFDLHHRTLVARTSFLHNCFSLEKFNHGFKLQFPAEPYDLGLEFNDETLANLYSEYNNWGKITNTRCVGDLNQHVNNNTIKWFMALNHALHDQKIVKIALDIYSRRDKVKLILAAGPSSSGKTTFAKKLSIQLEILGIKPVTISVDDYYKPNKECPLDENGNYDFETIDALRIDLLNEHLESLIKGEEVMSPIFDFKKGVPKDIGRKIKCHPGQVLLMEGIHCLNDKLTPKIPNENKYKIFLAPLTQLNLDEMNFISNNTTRLLRRMVRDFNFRGHAVTATLDMWPAVRKAEHRNVFPFMKNADVVFNTSLDYEYSVLKVYAKPLLSAVSPKSPHYNSARELLAFLRYFHAIPAASIPSDSLLREFIGDSFFDYE
ncbi:hypothetical protein FDP41_007440 [Naegleria fowleri]|uniref:Phosphoribulokinase/uridine kinase domain-containing protein n=1 Tax=Naegleria fowleri TaxID=5763 RepID=A0A6A5C1F7_NAEFO|nr:uncharacterized protein FDP41_007440 [Naegleria fowleri]KAF0984263.1 hypothetical protein FDP41_007440 [Naegleria fowleri]CAG4718094.1 unnamed protein product [Naegleria fowleri]